MLPILVVLVCFKLLKEEKLNLRFLILIYILFNKFKLLYVKYYYNNIHHFPSLFSNKYEGEK